MLEIFMIFNIPHKNSGNNNNNIQIMYSVNIRARTERTNREKKRKMKNVRRFLVSIYEEIGTLCKFFLACVLTDQEEIMMKKYNTEW